ncbi:MAG TPA: uracil-DNA glycosylase [Candidatus Binatia bacterium]|jgi:DNA polymerase|nr:uracil-DNA glycosylase [Candidatus Binatia bacterium]
MGTVTSQGAIGEVAHVLRSYVEHQRELGVLGYPPADRRPAPVAASARPAPRATPTPAPPEEPAPLPSAARPTSGDLFAGDLVRTRTLEELRREIGDCRRCKLAPHRTHLVFGVGNPRARLVFVGEAPGRDEDLQGEPFVGRAGQLLTEIIQKGMKLRRADVYIANVIKCRPPDNRNPEPDEVASCEPFLLRQLELIGPEVIVALGKFAAQALLQTKTPITQLRGRWYDYHGIRLMPTFHPAYLLRNPGDKRLVWEDIQKVMRALGIGGAPA